MAKSIQSDLNKLDKLIHPESRKTKQLHKKANRLEAREKSKKLHKMRENLIGEKILWFKERLLPDVKVYSGRMMMDIIEQYLGRFNEELEQISVHHSIGYRKNRRYASREDIINLTIMHDKEEFETCGIEIPDLMNGKQLAYLKDWNGELRYLQNMKLKRFTRKDLLKSCANAMKRERSQQNLKDPVKQPNHDSKGEMKDESSRSKKRSDMENDGSELGDLDDFDINEKDNNHENKKYLEHKTKDGTGDNLSMDVDS